MAVIDLEHVTKIYPNGIRAVGDLSLKVRDGEFFVFMGPSGSGKTTLLRLIAGLETPTRGAIRLDGRSITKLPPRDRDLAMVFQRPALYPHLDVRGNLSFGDRLRRRWAPWRGWLSPWGHDAGVEKIVEETADVLGLRPLLGRFPHELSGGQQQRVALGRAMVRRPKAFLLDEPLANLDLAGRAELRSELHLLHRRLQATILYITHDPIEAMTLGDRVAVLKQGDVQQIGRPLDLYEKPANSFVADSLGWPAMNRIAGRLRKTDGLLELELPGETVRLSLAGAPSVWSTWIDRDLTLGIRPEDVRCYDAGERLTIESVRPSLHAAGMEVVAMESFGGFGLVTVGRGALRMKALLSRPAGWERGQMVNVAIPMDRIHLFESMSGLAVCHAAGADG